LFFTFLHVSAEVEINSLCHHNELFTLFAELLVGAFIKQFGILKIYKRTTCEDSTLIGIGYVPTPQVLKDGVRLNRWTSYRFYHVYTNFAKIGKLMYIEMAFITYVRIHFNHIFRMKYLKFPKYMFCVRFRLY